MKQIKLKIKGMHCNSCVVLITEALEESDGIDAAKVSLDDKEAIISFDETKINEAKIKEIVEEEGFEIE